MFDLAPRWRAGSGELRCGARGESRGVISSGRFRFWAIDWVTRLVRAAVVPARPAWSGSRSMAGGCASRDGSDRRAGCGVPSRMAPTMAAPADGCDRRDVRDRGSRFRRRQPSLAAAGRGGPEAFIPASRGAALGHRRAESVSSPRVSRRLDRAARAHKAEPGVDPAGPGPRSAAAAAAGPHGSRAT